LLYVAITRAENHVFFASGEEQNTFLEELPVSVESMEPDIRPVDAVDPTQVELPFAVTLPEGPIGHTPHSLMDESVFEEMGERMEQGADHDTESETRGLDFGSQVHDFAEAYALGEEVTPSNDHERRVQAFIDGLPGTLHVEESVTLPIEVDRTKVTISGVVDLVHETDETVDIVDYKTDSTRRAQPEYRKQLSVYYHVLSEWFTEKDITAGIFYTGDDELVHIEPLSPDELRDIVRQHM
jgi:ATP-dependent exoDNAse (exonuclease V) beta subunit